VPEDRQRLYRRFPFASLSCNGRLVTLSTPGLLSDAADIEDFVDLAGAVAQHGVAELERLTEALPNARYAPPKGPWKLRTPPRLEVDSGAGPIVVTFTHLSSPKPLGVRMSIAPRRDLGAFSVDLIDGRIEGDPPRGLVPDDAREALGPIGRATLSGSPDRIRLSFPAVPAEDEARAAVRLLAGVAGDRRTVGAFR
jgi:hypothetical protein